MAEPDDPSLATFASVAERYFAQYGDAVTKEARWFGAACQSMEQAILRAVGSEVPNARGRLLRHGHQQRIPARVLQEAKAVLLCRSNELRSAVDFNTVYEIVDIAIGAIPGVGELLVYDVAHRIGEYLSLFPESVYLHAGTRLGASGLNLKTNRKAIPIDEFPAGLRNLDGAQLEDVLCIYRSTLIRLGNDGESLFSTTPSQRASLHRQHC